MSSNSMTKFINFNKIFRTNQSPCPFIIVNTSRKNKKGVHWWSILNIDPKKELLLFDSYGFIGFKFFILSDDKAIVDKILYNVNNFNKKDNKINLVTVTFSVDAQEKLKENKLNALTETARDLLHKLAEFSKYNSMTNEMKLFA